MPLPKKQSMPELRYDSINKDWVLVATSRSLRPDVFKRKEKKKGTSSKECPFCGFNKKDKPVLIFRQGKKVFLKQGAQIPPDWTILVKPNKYPAVISEKRLKERQEGGLYKTMPAIGFHEVVIFKDHQKDLASFSIEELREVFDVYQERYLSLAKEKFVNYISIFHNKGPLAGASIAHPHSQIITTPLVDCDLQRAISNSEMVFKEKGTCPSCLINNWEKKAKKRIVFENNNFLAICPFASKFAFQTVIIPKNHLSNFEKITPEDKTDLADTFSAVLRKLYKGLNDPDYNFYLHTAPCDGKKYQYFHWHWTIIPKTSVLAGFELGTRMEILTIEPEKAADYLRKIKV